MDDEGWDKSGREWNGRVGGDFPGYLLSDRFFLFTNSKIASTLIFSSHLGNHL